MRNTRIRILKMKRSKKWKVVNGRKSSNPKKKYLSLWLIFNSVTAKNAQAKKWKDSDYSAPSRIKRKSTKEWCSVLSVKKPSAKKTWSILKSMVFA